MTFDAVAYWNRVPPPPHFITPEHAAQEAQLLDVLHGLDFRSVLEVGCGYGRVTELIAELTPEPITVIDIGADQVAATTKRVPQAIGTQSSIQAFDSDQRWDLVISTEVLMHVPPADIQAVCDKLKRLSKRWIVTCDWTEPLDKPTAQHNWLHDYESLFGGVLRAIPTGLQTIYVIEVAE